MSIIYKEILNFISEDICEKIIHDNDNNLSEAKTYKGYIDDRKSKIKFISIPEIEEMVLKELNESISLKNFKISKKEDIQFTKYELGEYYDWHYDTPRNIEGNSYINKEDIKNRTYSVVIQLNDNYEGGEFLYEDYNTKEIKNITKKRGTLFMFNSSVKHKVNKITDGVRYSLVLWTALEKINENKTLI